MDLLSFFQKNVDLENFFTKNDLTRKASLIVVWVISMIPAIILFQSFWQPGPGSSSGLFFFLYPALILIPNIIAGLMMGLILGVSDVSGLRVLMFSGIAQNLAVILSTTLSSQGEDIVDRFIFAGFVGLFTIPALPLVLIELGISYGLGHWLGKKCRTRLVSKNIDAITPQV